METQARIGYGGTLELADYANPSVYTYIHEVRDFTLPSETTGTEDVTHMQSPNRTREFISTLTDPGEISWDMNLVPGSASDLYLMGTKGKKQVWRYTFPSGHQFIGIGERTSYEKTAPVEGRMASTVTFKISGEPSLTDETAPRNIVALVITGVAQVGVPLMVDPGVWAGAEDLEYQWNVDGVAVIGATGTTYVPVVADAGKPVTVTITASNEIFDTTVTSAPTANVELVS